MAFFTFLLTVLIVFLVQIQCTVAQVIYKPEPGASSMAFNPGHKSGLVYSGNTSFVQNFRNSQLQKPGYRPQLSYYTKYCPPATFTLRNISSDDWLYEHNLVTVKSIVAIVNRLCVGINCRYNWAFAIAGNGLGMVLNKAPIKIAFAAEVGGAPNLCHR
jgi:hypothetical protein